MSVTSRLVRQPKIKLTANTEQLFNDTESSPITFGVILPPKLCGKISTNSQNNPITLDENKNSKVHTTKILLDSGASASVVPKGVLYKRYEIFKDKKNK